MMYRMIIIDADSGAMKHIVQSVDWPALGFDVAATFSSGKDALSYIKSASVDAVLLSAECSGADAMDVAMFVHQNVQNCQVVLMSSSWDYDFMKRAMQCGVCDHILKPIDPDKLRNSLELLRGSLDKSKILTSQYARANRKQTSKKQQTGTSTAAMVRQAASYIDKNLLEGISLGAVSEHLHTSTSHLIRIFKKETGHTYLEYVTKKKMEKAADLLAKENLKVYEVSTMLGYRSTRHFSTLFFKQFGCYPSEYARNLTEN